MDLYEGMDAAGTENLRKEGVELLNFWRLEDTEAKHVARSLDALDLPLNAKVIDLGCGTGKFARLASSVRADISFTLVNTSQAQLDLCPPWMERINADLIESCRAFKEDSFDAVVMAYAMGHVELVPVLESLGNVLKPGGKLYLHDLFATTAESVRDLKGGLNYDAHFLPEVVSLARIVGLDLVQILDDPHVAPGSIVQGARSLIDRLDHGVLIFVKSDRPHALRKGGKVALSFSGGKDSLACLELLRPWWDNIIVSWLNPGNPFPETVALMDDVRAAVPHFEEVAGRQRDVIAADGWPSDLVPQHYTTDGNMIFGQTEFKVQTRLSCCTRSLMQPMYEHMLSSGVKICIRGKRHDEADKTGLQTGYVTPDGLELLFPIYDWTAGFVHDYLGIKRIALPPFYQHANHSLDCMDCTAWWGEGLSRYLEKVHPLQFAEYKRRVILIKQAVADQLAECEV
jgi:3'-phosphoadenosine 5'-phosphosulfate sulfotransferase (PAPS reductase)/FAD synthetase